MGDNGGVLNYDQLLVLCSQSGINLTQEIKKAKIEDTLSQLPFVYVYERSDFSTKLYGAIIYPEYIKRGIQKNEFQKYITGKFTMFTKSDENHDEYLEINLELQPDIKSSAALKKLITTTITDVLVQESSEHRNNMSLLARSKVEPRIIFWSYEHETYFKPGGKQKWVKK
jgi:phenylacetate-CoA ligase